MNSITHATTRLSGSRMILAMLMWLVPVAPTLASMPQTPTESVRSTIEDVIRILNNEQWKQAERLAKRRQEIERSDMRVVPEDEQRASLEGSFVKKVLAWEKCASRVNDCKAIGGLGGWKQSRRGWAGED